jgi:DNA repair protein RecO (recombination protein O)
VPYRDADLVVTLFTEEAGAVAAMARGARRSAKRLGALEPFHGLSVSLEDRGGDLMALRESRVLRVRGGLVASLDAVDAAGIAMRWTRHLLPPRTPEPEAYALATTFLDALDEGAPARAELAAFGLRLLFAVGYGLDLGACVRCGRPCPPGRAALVDAARGGLVCQSCGGAARALSGEERASALALMAGERPTVARAVAEALVSLAEDAMAVHAGYDPPRR